MVLITHIIVQIVNSWKTISYSLPHITWWSSSNRWSTFTNPSTYARRARAHTHNIEWNMRQTVEPGNEMIWWFCYCKGGRNMLLNAYCTYCTHTHTHRVSSTNFIECSLHDASFLLLAQVVSNLCVDMCGYYYGCLLLWETRFWAFRLGKRGIFKSNRNVLFPLSLFHMHNIIKRTHTYT